MHCMVICLIHKSNSGSVQSLVESLNGIFLDLIYKVIYRFSCVHDFSSVRKNHSVISGLSTF